MTDPASRQLDLLARGRELRATAVTSRAGGDPRAQPLHPDRCSRSREPVLMRRSYAAESESVGRIRCEIGELALSAGAREDTVANVRLAVSEAAANSVRYAYGAERGRIHVTAVADASQLAVVVADDGDGLSHPHGEPGLGFGLALMEESADELSVTELETGGLEVRLVFVLGPRPAP